MIALVFCGNIEYCPYVENYIQHMDNSSCYTVFYWNRACLDTKLPENYYGFRKHSELTASPLQKLKDFISFRKWLKGKIKKYDKIVLLETLSAMLLYDVLIKRPHEYIMEIRDYSYEKKRIFRFLESILIKRSYCSFISSPGFKNFLPKADYLLCHNIAHFELPQNMGYSESIDSPINLVWAGAIRYYDTQVRIIRLLANNSRFELYYHGAGHALNDLKAYCDQHSITNVHFTGFYKEKDKIKLLQNADFILNAYSENVETQYALSNRFYDALLLGVPQIVENGGYKADIIKQYKLGIVLDDNLPENIIQAHEKYDKEDFKKRCNGLLSEYMQDNQKCFAKIRKFIEESKC